MNFFLLDYLSTRDQSSSVQENQNAWLQGLPERKKGRRSFIFVHDIIAHVPQPLNLYRDEIDAIGMILNLANGNHLVIKLLYSPCGNDDIQNVFKSAPIGNNSFFFVDLKVHSKLGEQTACRNKAGRGTENIWSNVLDTLIFTLFNFPTWYTISSNAFSIIELLFGPSSYYDQFQMVKVPSLQSDHSAILT